MKYVFELIFYFLANATEFLDLNCPTTVALFSKKCMVYLFVSLKLCVFLGPNREFFHSFEDICIVHVQALSLN